MSNPHAYTDENSPVFIYSEPPDVNKKMTLLNKGFASFEGKWKDSGAIAWCPVPKRDKKREKELGYI